MLGASVMVLPVAPVLEVMLGKERAILRMILDYGPKRIQTWVLEDATQQLLCVSPHELRFPPPQKIPGGNPSPPNSAFNMVKTPTPSKTASLQIIHRMGMWLDRFREARAGDSAYSRVFRDLAGECEQLFTEIFGQLSLDPSRIAAIMADVSERQGALESLHAQMSGLLVRYRQTPDTIGHGGFVDAIERWKSICEAVTGPVIIPAATPNKAA